MELRQVRYFVTIAQRLSFTSAAEALGVAQPALSQQMRVLERELGVALFERTSRRVRLTEAGKVFLQRAEQLIADADQARQEMQEFAGLSRGKAVVGVVPNLGEEWLARLLAAFHRRYPGIEMALSEDTTLHLMDDLSRGSLDLALMHQPARPIPANLEAYPLFTEELVLAAGRHHALAGQAQVSLETLRHEGWIMVKPGSIIRETVFDAMTVAGFTPRIVCETGALSTISALVAVGLGVAILPRSVVETASAALSLVELSGPALTRTVAVVWRAEAYHSAAARAFMDFARKAEQTQ